MDVVERLTERGIQPSAQRVAVAQYVLFTEEHPSADQVWARVRGSFPQISRATVYNTLHLFSERGLWTGDQRAAHDARATAEANRDRAMADHKAMPDGKGMADRKPGTPALLRATLPAEHHEQVVVALSQSIDRGRPGRSIDPLACGSRKGRYPALVRRAIAFAIERLGNLAHVASARVGLREREHLALDVRERVTLPLRLRSDGVGKKLLRITLGLKLGGASHYSPLFRYLSNHATVRSSASIWFSRLAKPWPSSG